MGVIRKYRKRKNLDEQADDLAGRLARDDDSDGEHASVLSVFLSSRIFDLQTCRCKKPRLSFGESTWPSGTTCSSA